jgi:carboxypeptidase Taq
MSIFEKAREHALIRSAADALGWDQETYLPASAAEHRAAQLSWLASRAHELAVSDEWKRDLEEAEAGDTGNDPHFTANLRELRRQFERSTKLPVELVARESAATSIGMHVWAEARKNSDFTTFAPHLETLVELAREKADLWGYPSEPYDALLDGYERATSTTAVAALFDSLSPRLTEIASAAVEKSAAQPVSLPKGPYPIEDQQRLNREIAESIGFDFSAGRIDTTNHPFCTTLGPQDIRLTTRYDENDFTSSLFGVLHEAGHGLYEQGLPGADFGLPSGTAVSLGIHESQSRLWENHVGRSDGFWQHWYPRACEIFPQLSGMPLENFLRYIRHAAFSPIRVEADEATYDLHILLRFGIERLLLNGELKVRDVPAAWNESVSNLFGFTPEDDRHGCLQDIHWSMGGLGYFPTYSLGNLNSAQLFAAAGRDETVARALSNAEYAPLLSWLRTNVHAHGSIFDPAELIRQATGDAPSPDAYVAHLTERYL